MPRKPLALILCTIFLDVLGIGPIVPVAPFYARAFGADALQVGLLFTAFSAMQFLSTPTLGAPSDRFGRRPILTRAFSRASLRVPLVLAFLVSFAFAGFPDEFRGVRRRPLRLRRPRPASSGRWRLASPLSTSARRRRTCWPRTTCSGAPAYPRAGESVRPPREVAGPPGVMSTRA